MLLVRAELFAAVDVEQLDLGPAVCRRAASSVTRVPHPCLGRRAPDHAGPGQTRGWTGSGWRRGPVRGTRPSRSTQIDVQVGAAVLGSLSSHHIISQLAKDTDALSPLCTGYKRQYRVQPGNVRCALDGQLDAERSAEASTAPFDYEEVLLTAPGSKAQMQTPSGSSVTGSCFGCRC